MGVRGWISLGAITNYHRLGRLSTTEIYFVQSESWKFDIRVPAWTGSGESSLPGVTSPFILHRGKRAS